MTSTETTKTEPLTWAMPGWASETAREEPGGIVHRRSADTVPASFGSDPGDEGRPVSVELTQAAYLNVADGRVSLDRQPAIITVDDLSFTVAEAHKLTQALCELLELVTSIGHQVDRDGEL